MNREGQHGEEGVGQCITTVATILGITAATNLLLYGILHLLGWRITLQLEVLRELMGVLR